MSVEYTSETLRSFFADRDTRTTARVWANEALLHDLAEFGITFFEGDGTNPTGLSGYATTKLWLRVAAGVTTTPGEIRCYDESGDATLLASWPVLDAAGLRRHLSLYSKSDADGRYVRTVNGTGPDVSGNVVVFGGGGGSGDVVGPAASVDGRLAVFDGTTGKLLKDGGLSAGSFDAAGTSAAAIAAHLAAADPHTQYHNNTRGDARYVRTVNGTGPDGAGNVAVAGGAGAGDVVGPPSSVNDRIALFNGTTGKLIKDSGLTSAAFDPAGTSTAAIAAHIAAADPHTLYALEARAVLRAMVEGYWITEVAGVVGNDAADCTAGIATAISTVAAAGGGIVYIPVGIFRVTGLGNIPANVKIVGADRHKSVIRTTSATAVVMQPNGAKISLHNFTIDSAVTRTAGAYVNITSLVSEFSAEKLTLRAAFYALQVNAGGAIYSFKDIDIEDTVATSGVSFRILGGFLVYVDDLICRNSTAARPFAHIEITAVDDMMLMNSQLLSAANDMVIAPGTGNTVALLRTYGTMFDDASGNGVRVAPTTGGNVFGLHIESPWIKGGSADILVTNAGGGVINGISLVNSDCVGTTTGIDWTGATNIVVSGNRAGSKTVAGAALTNCVGGCVSDNVLGPWGPYGGNAIGLYLGGTTDKLSIVGNRVDDNTTNYTNSASGTALVIAANSGIAVNKLTGGLDVGPITVAGSITATGNLSVGADIVKFTRTGYVSIYGGDGYTTGAGIVAYGDQHATTPNELWLVNNGFNPRMKLAANGDATFTQGLRSIGALGYATGAGGAVTQITNKATAVTLNKLSGTITTTNGTVNAASATSFTLNNTFIAAEDTVTVTIKSGAATGGSYTVVVDAVAAGSCRISIRNHSAGALADTLVISFAVIKGVVA